MLINHLQLNTGNLEQPDSIAEYFLEKDIHVASLQEIVAGYDNHSELKPLLESKGYHYIESVSFYYDETKSSLGNAIVSRYPIIDYTTMYFNSADYRPKRISEADIIGKNLIDFNTVNESPTSRGLKHAIKSQSVLIALIYIPELDKNLRVYSIQYNVSSWATETEQMYNHTQLIKSHFDYSAEMPTIMAGDFNVQANSFSIELLGNSLTCHTKGLINTLSDSHRALDKDFPGGLAVDHVFSANIEHQATSTEQINFSDHKSLISIFNI